MAAWFTDQPLRPTWIWSSSAARAQATARFVARGCGVAPEEVSEHEALYHASERVLLDRLRETPDDVSSVAIVAHNPGITYLTNRLGRTTVTDNVPTFGVARFAVTGSWASLTFGAATLQLFTAPKMLSAED